MQKEDTNDLLHQELGFISWDIFDSDILLIKSEFEKLIAKDISNKDEKRIEKIKTMMSTSYEGQQVSSNI